MGKTVKSIVYEPGKPPQFGGSWTMADFYALLRFILDMPLIQAVPDAPKEDDNG